MTPHRTKRSAVRRRATPMFVTERDLDALVLVGLTRYLGADQLARALFPNSDRCTRRARRLFDEGLLQKVVLSSRRPDLLALTGKGIAFVEKRRPEVADRLRLAGPIRVAGVAHHRAVVDSRLYAAGVGELRQAPLTRWSGAGDSAAAALALAGLKPDGIAEFATADGPATIAVECDLGSETQRVLTSKFSRYRAAASSAALDGLWVVAAGGPERLATVERLLSAAGLDEFGRVIPHGHTIRRPVEDLPPRTAPSGWADSPNMLLGGGQHGP